MERMTAGAALYELPTPRIAVGQPANLCLVDLDARFEVGEDGYVSRSANCAFHGRTLHGRVLLTLAAGAVAFRRPMLVTGDAEARSGGRRRARRGRADGRPLRHRLRPAPGRHPV